MCTINEAQSEPVQSQKAQAAVLKITQDLI